jgi:hypothetical protein
MWPPHNPDINPCDFFLWKFLKEKVSQRRPENVAQLRAHVVKLCCTLSDDLCRKVVTNARVRLQEVVRQNGGHIEYVLSEDLCQKIVTNARVRLQEVVRQNDGHIEHVLH